MSARVERNWPSLIATGPWRSRASASRSPGRPRARRATRRTAAGTRAKVRARRRQQRVEFARDQGVGADQRPGGARDQPQVRASLRPSL